VDARPPVWIGHAVLRVTDVERAASFWCNVGMREVVRSPEVAVLELRGGTHLVLAPADAPLVSSDAPFDLMVEDLEATHREWSARGIDVGEITRGRIHLSFTVTDPDGNRVTVNSSHVVGDV
jgi:catechol 2,3-dioxygenase-like lactoylglutathione lyase family enzyme